MTVYLGVVGFKGSGKTLVVETLVTGMNKVGYSVATLKYIHLDHIEIDLSGKDTKRHMKAGAKVTIAISPHEMVIFMSTISTPASQSLEEVGKFIPHDIDFVICEGVPSDEKSLVGRIIVAKNERDLSKRMKRDPEPFIVISGPVVDHFPPGMEGVFSSIKHVPKVPFSDPDFCKIVLRRIARFRDK